MIIPEPAILGTNPATKRPVTFPAFDGHAMNGHTTVLGDPESGKTLAAKLRLIRDTENGTQVTVIDHTGEYAALTRNLKGRVIRPGTHPFNLDSIPTRVKHPEDLATLVWTTIIPALAVLTGKSPDHQHYQAAGYTLESLYQPNPEGAGGLDAYCRHIQAHYQQNKTATDLAEALTNFLDDGGRDLLSAQTHSSTHEAQGPLCFDLSQLPDHLRKAATVLCLHHVWQQAVADPQPRILIIDECLPLLEDEATAETLTGIIKRARKRLLGIMAMTRHAEDFLNPDKPTGRTGQRLLQNSGTTLVLRQIQKNLALVADALGFNQAEAATLYPGNRGEGLLTSPIEPPVPVQIAATPDEEDLLR